MSGQHYQQQQNGGSGNLELILANQGQVVRGGEGMNTSHQQNSSITCYPFSFQSTQNRSDSDSSEAEMLKDYQEEEDDNDDEDDDDG